MPDGHVMERTIETPPTDDETLAKALEALASVVRIQILRAIRAPRTVTEIKVQANRESRHEGLQDRLVARQTVKEHLDRLVEVGVVRTRESQRDKRSTLEYVVNHQGLFLLAESFRSLAHLRPQEPVEGATVMDPRRTRGHKARGPCLVLVKGLDEGRTFPLATARPGSGSWVIGRRGGLAVALDYDPYVSSENAEVVQEDGKFMVRDLPENRNGTHLNFEPLPRGGTRALQTGDIIGVGRSLLMFRA